MNALKQIDWSWYASLQILFYTKIITPTNMDNDSGQFRCAPHVLTTTLRCLDLRLKLMCSHKTESNKRIHPTKLAPKLTHKKLDMQKLTGKNYYGKRSVSGEIVHWCVWRGLFIVLVVYGSNVDGQRAWEKVEWNACHSE